MTDHEMKYERSDAAAFEKHGADMWDYFGEGGPDQADVLYIEVDGGHYEEFYHEKCAFVYYVLEGEGEFYLDGEEIKVTATDVIAAPPNTKIYYLGTMKLLLVTAPGWEEETEHHVRDIPRE